MFHSSLVFIWPISISSLANPLRGQAFGKLGCKAQALLSWQVKTKQDTTRTTVNFNHAQMMTEKSLDLSGFTPAPLWSWFRLYADKVNSHPCSSAPTTLSLSLSVSLSLSLHPIVSWHSHSINSAGSDRRNNQVDLSGVLAAPAVSTWQAAPGQCQGPGYFQLIQLLTLAPPRRTVQPEET